MGQKSEALMAGLCSRKFSRLRPKKAGGQDICHQLVEFERRARTLSEHNEIINAPDNELNLPSENDKVLNINSNDTRIDFRNVLASLIHIVDMSKIISSIETATQYVVDVPVQYQEDLKNNLLEINQNSKTKVMWPTIVKRLKNNKKEFVDNLPIHEEKILQGNPMHEISTGMQMMHLQQQVAELTQLVKDAYEAILLIDEELKADKIGLLNAGYEGIQHALQHEGEQQLHELIVAQAQLREAKNRIGEVLKTRIDAFSPVEKNQLFRIGLMVFDKNYNQKKDDAYHKIQDYFYLYLRAVQLHAASFTLVGDTKVAEQIYNDAKDFIRSLNLSSIESIRYIHQNVPDSDFFFPNVVEKIEQEKQLCLEEAKPYDFVEISFTGEELLEVYNDGEREA